MPSLEKASFISVKLKGGGLKGSLISIYRFN
jgi:hypothetical protein